MKHPVELRIYLRASFIITIKRKSSEVDWICCIFAKFVAYLLPMNTCKELWRIKSIGEFLFPMFLNGLNKFFILKV